MSAAKLKPFTSATQSYRHLIRSCRSLFIGDSLRLNAALTEINRQYKENRELSDPAQLAEKFQFARDIDTILRQNVVQGVQSERDPENYHLNIRADTELGYNDTIKMKKTANRPATNLGGCGSDAKR